MNKLVIFAGLLSLAGCSEALPEVGSALEKASEVAGDINEAYQMVKSTRAALESVYTQACIPPVVAAAVDPCSRIRVALDKAAEVEGKSYEALSVAIDALNVAIVAYNEVNDNVE